MLPGDTAHPFGRTGVAGTKQVSETRPFRLTVIYRKVGITERVEANSEPLGLRRQLSEIKADLGLPNDFVVPEVHGQKTLSILSHQKDLEA